MNSSEGLKVLVTDDNITTRMLLAKGISRWGYKVIEAEDGEQAWEIMQKSDAPRLLILDWRMPKLDGIELCKLIRSKLDFYPYVILLTEMQGATNTVTGLEAGADEFLSKPFNMPELQSRLASGAKIVKYQQHIRNISKYISSLSVLTQELPISCDKSKIKELQQNIAILADEFAQLSALNKNGK